MIANQIPKSPRELEQFYRDLVRTLGNLAGIAWSLVNKAGSRLNEITIRPHSDLEDILDWQDGANSRHISVADGEAWQSHIEEVNGNPHGTDHAMLDAISVLDPTSADIIKDRHLSDAQGKVWQDHVGASRDVHGIGAGNSVVGTGTAQTISGKKYGSDTDYSEFESDGTAHFVGDATVWKDIFFPMAPPKTTGAGNPTLTTWNGNLRGYVFAVNDTHDFDPQEFAHDGKEGSTATWHIHFVSRTNVAADRAVKFQLEYSQADRNGVFPAPTTVSTEIVIPSGTTANTHIAEDIATFTTGDIAGQMSVKLTRIAAVGTAPADDPVIIGVHYHYELDTVGSREIFSKG